MLQFLSNTEQGFCVTWVSPVNRDSLQTLPVVYQVKHYSPVVLSLYNQRGAASIQSEGCSQYPIRKYQPLIAIVSILNFVSSGYVSACVQP